MDPPPDVNSYIDKLCESMSVIIITSDSSSCVDSYIDELCESMSNLITLDSSSCVDRYIDELCELMSNLIISDSSSSEQKIDKSPNISMDFRTPVSKSDQPKEKNRCNSCNRKVGLLGFKCRCGDLFCGKHRHPEDHTCKINYKQIIRDLINQLNMFN